MPPIHSKPSPRSPAKRKRTSAKTVAISRKPHHVELPSNIRSVEDVLNGVPIPRDTPVHAAVVLVATDPAHVETLHEHITELLHKAGTGISAFFHKL